MRTARRKFGDEGEELAAGFLAAAGLRVLKRQVRVGRMGEIDLLCQDGETLVFVEVKTRRDARYGSPEEAMHAGKRMRLRNAVLGFLSAHGLLDARYRVDVVAVDLTRGEPEIRHLKNVTL